MSITRNDLRGIFPAIPSPVDAKGRFDKFAVRPMIDYLFDGGMSGVVALGGTGEFLALSPKERIEVVSVTAQAVNGRGLIIAGVLSPGFREAVESGKELIRAGAGVLMLVTPYYVASSQAALREYFRAYAQEVGAPTLLYDIPYKTRVTVHPDTIAGMVEDGSIVGMKACNTDIDHFTRVVEQVGEKIAVLSGEDHLLPLHLAIGATGSVHATANLFPRQWKQLYDLACRGELSSALEQLARMRPVMQALFSEGNPGPLKATMAMIGLPVGHALRPLCPPSPDLKGRLEKIIAPFLEEERRLASR